MTGALFATYRDALLACESDGYDSGLICDVVYEKTVRFRESLLATQHLDLEAARTVIFLASTSFSPLEPLNVLDFGGACGAHFWIARTVQPGRPFDWRVVETSAMVERASRQFEVGLNFHCSIASATTNHWIPDVVFASSSIQYVSDTEYTLGAIFGLGAKQVFITRTPWSDFSKPIVVVQRSALSANGPGPLPQRFHDQAVEYPLTLFPWRQLLAIASANKYHVRYSIDEARPTRAIGNIAVDTTRTVLFELAF
jgi:putative methyltransferase (TIGR04325 family)